MELCRNKIIVMKKKKKLQFLRVAINPSKCKKKKSLLPHLVIRGFVFYLIFQLLKKKKNYLHNNNSLQ